MSRTGIGSNQIRDNSVERADMCTTKAGSAVITKILSGNGITIEQSSGADEGTGDVVLRVTETFKFVKVAPDAIWDINHNMNKNPSVTVFDSTGDGSVVFGDVKYIDQNNVRITFSAAFAGEAHLN
jgi:hypothetical protein